MTISDDKKILTNGWQYKDKVMHDTHNKKGRRKIINNQRISYWARFLFTVAMCFYFFLPLENGIFQEQYAWAMECTGDCNTSSGCWCSICNLDRKCYNCFTNSINGGNLQTSCTSGINYLAYSTPFFGVKIPSFQMQSQSVNFPFFGYYFTLSWGSDDWVTFYTNYDSSPISSFSLPSLYFQQNANTGFVFKDSFITTLFFTTNSISSVNVNITDAMGTQVCSEPMPVEELIVPDTSNIDKLIAHKNYLYLPYAEKFLEKYGNEFKLDENTIKKMYYEINDYIDQIPIEISALPRVYFLKAKLSDICKNKEKLVEGGTYRWDFTIGAEKVSSFNNPALIPYFGEGAGSSFWQFLYTDKDSNSGTFPTIDSVPKYDSNTKTFTVTASPGKYKPYLCLSSQQPPTNYELLSCDSGKFHFLAAHIQLYREENNKSVLECETDERSGVFDFSQDKSSIEFKFTMDSLKKADGNSCNLSGGTVYSWRAEVRDFSNINYSGFYIFTSPAEVVGIPESVTASAEGGKISIRWSAVTSAEKYKIYYYNKTLNTQWQIGTSTTSSYTDGIWVKVGQESCYKVSAVKDSVGESKLSTLACATIPIDTNPPSMSGTNLSATIIENGVELRWEPSSASDLAGYKIFRTDSNGNKILVATIDRHAISYRDVGSMEEGLYTYSILPYDVNGNSGTEINFLLVNFAEKIIYPPSRLNAVGLIEGLVAKVYLFWDASPSADVTGYNIYRASAPAGNYGLIQSGITSLEFSDTGLTNGTNYCYKITAVLTDGKESEKSTEYVCAKPMPTVLKVQEVSSPVIDPYEYDDILDNEKTVIKYCVTGYYKAVTLFIYREDDFTRSNPVYIKSNPAPEKSASFENCKQGIFVWEGTRSEGGEALVEPGNYKAVVQAVGMNNEVLAEKSVMESETGCAKQYEAGGVARVAQQAQIGICEFPVVVSSFLHVIDLNIHASLEKKITDPWEPKIDYVNRKFTKSYLNLVMGLQEVGWELVPSLWKGLDFDVTKCSSHENFTYPDVNGKCDSSLNEYTPANKLSGILPIIGNELMWKGIKVVERGEYELPSDYTDPDPPYKTYSGERRVLQKIKAQIKNREIVIWNLHLECCEERLREHQMRQVADIILAEKTIPDQILMGDFNDQNLNGDSKEYPNASLNILKSKGWNPKEVYYPKAPKPSNPNVNTGVDAIIVKGNLYIIHSSISPSHDIYAPTDEDHPAGALGVEIGIK